MGVIVMQSFEWEIKEGLVVLITRIIILAVITSFNLPRITVNDQQFKKGISSPAANVTMPKCYADPVIIQNIEPTKY